MPEKENEKESNKTRLDGNFSDFIGLWFALVALLKSLHCLLFFIDNYKVYPHTMQGLISCWLQKIFPSFNKIQSSPSFFTFY